MRTVVALRTRIPAFAGTTVHRARSSIQRRFSRMIPARASVREETMPAALMATAHSDDGVIMGIRHREWPVDGVQFHPESVLTEHGMRMVANWLRRSQLATIPIP